MAIAYCLKCKKEFKFNKHSSRGKFCSTLCRTAFNKAERIRKIKAGENVGLRGMKQFLMDKQKGVCALCKILPVWNKKKLVFQLDHKDGDSDNNFWKNLRLLCPNCHTQTSNFGSKGKGNRYKKETKRNRYLREYKA